MGRLLNNFFLALMLIFFCGEIAAQEKPHSGKNYQNKDEFKKFSKRADQVASWQIQNLKFGALVVRFQTNQLKIDACNRVGDTKMANQVKAETQFYIKTMMRAYASKFDFCKVYFIFSQSSDSLLNGIRKGIFIDSTLKINKEITMTEKFYLLAEKDFIYNSSIGFVKEDTAKYVKENGDRSIEVAVVLKNKYGHQLKKPFPFYIKQAFLKSASKYENSVMLETAPGKFEKITFEISKDVTLEKQGEYLRELNDALLNFYKYNQGIQIDDKSLEPFLY